MRNLARSGHRLEDTFYDTVRLGWQLFIDGKSIDQVEWDEVAISAGIGAVTPGAMGVLTKGRRVDQVILKTRKAIAALNQRAARSQGGVKRLQNQIRKQEAKIKAEVQELADTVAQAASGILAKNGLEAGSEEKPPPPPPPPPPDKDPQRIPSKGGVQ